MIAEILNNPSRYQKVASSLTINVRVCYDKSFRRRMGWNDERSKQVLLEIVSYASHIFLHPSLEIEVHINLISICLIGKMCNIFESMIMYVVRHGIKSRIARVEKS